MKSLSFIHNQQNFQFELVENFKRIYSNSKKEDKYLSWIKWSKKKKKWEKVKLFW